jgi:hypothetical protein
MYWGPDERPVEDYLLQRAAIARARSERQIVEAVIAARATGMSWQRSGERLGTSVQAAQQRYGSLHGIRLTRVSAASPL